MYLKYHVFNLLLQAESQTNLCALNATALRPGATGVCTNDSLHDAAPQHYLRIFP